MKKYSKKQIVEAIKHWKNQLRKMNESIPGCIVVGDPTDINSHATEDSSILIRNARDYSRDDSFDNIIEGANFGIYCLGYFVKCKDYDELAKTVATLKKLQDMYDDKYMN